MSQASASDVAKPFHVAIVGGGISGLSTAWYVEKEAAARGIPVVCTVFESNQRWGGRIRTDLIEHEAGGFVIEGGPDSFLATQKPWAVDLALELGLAGRLLGTNDAARKVYVLSKGKPVRMPDGVFLLVPTKLKPFALSPLISPLGKLRMGLDLFIPARKDGSDEALGDFVTRRFGSEALDKIAEPLLSGIYNAEAERQSLLATFPRFRETELLHGSLIRGMLASRVEARRKRGRRGTASPAPAAAPGRPSSTFASFTDGTEEIIARLTESLQAKLRAEDRVTSLDHAGARGYFLEVSRVGAREPVAEVIRADAVVLAVPAYEAAALLAAVCPEAAGALSAIRYVSTGTLSMAYKRKASGSLPLGFGVLVPRSEKRPLNAVTWSSTKFDHRAPEGYSLLRVFFGGSRSPETMQFDDEELVAVVKKELTNMLGIDQEPEFHRVYRWGMANPQYDVEHLQRVENIERVLPLGVWVTGSAYRGVGLPDCVHQGQMTAARVIERLQDRQRSAL